MTSDTASDDPKRALEDARRLAAEGDYESALAKHVWFHDHALRIDRSYYGVRLSFALGDWIQLGEKYPKALETLKGVRDTKTAKLLTGHGNRELFHDVESINQYLGESVATVDLFKHLAAFDPIAAGNLYDLADEALLETREFELARKYLGNPADRLVTAQRNFEEGMQFAESARNRTVSRQAHQRIFVAEVVRLLTVLNETGDRDEARVIQAEALNTFDDESIRNALV